jgi:hypothetical protein
MTGVDLDLLGRNYRQNPGVGSTYEARLEQRLLDGVAIGSVGEDEDLMRRTIDPGALDGETMACGHLVHQAVERFG